MLSIVLITLVSLAGSFFCSLLEASIYSVTRSRIESLRRDGKRSGERLVRIRGNIDEAIAAILICNTFANSFGGVVAGGLISRHYGDWRLGVLTGATVFGLGFTLSVLLLSEITPKSLGVKYASRLAPALSWPLAAMITILHPFVRVCVLFTRLWSGQSSLHHTTEEDIISLTGLGLRQGQILPEEAEWVANALRLNDVTAWDLMTPNSVVARVPDALRMRDTTIDAQHWRFSRLPVCADDDPDRIVGIVHRQRVFDALARDQFNLTMSDLMMPPVFVEDSMPAHRLLDEFLKQRRHLFCVRDEGGHFVGVVSLEDVMECLLGEEIVDESDLHEDMQEVARERRKRLLGQSRRLIEGAADPATRPGAGPTAG